MQLTRRAVLTLGASAGAATLVGCTGSGAKHGNPSPTSPGPDSAALATARRDELALLASYDHLIKRTPLRNRAPLQVERAIHATHLTALHGVAAPARRGHADIRQSLLASARRLRRLSLQASDGTNAALLASIAASHTASSA